MLGTVGSTTKESLEKASPTASSADAITGNASPVPIDPETREILAVATQAAWRMRDSETQAGRASSGL